MNRFKPQAKASGIAALAKTEAENVEAKAAGVVQKESAGIIGFIKRLLKR